MAQIPEIGIVEGTLQSIEEICTAVLGMLQAQLQLHTERYPSSPWSYVNAAKLEKNLSSIYSQMGKDIGELLSHSIDAESSAGYERAKQELRQSGIYQNVIGKPDERRIRNAMKSTYTNVALRTDKMSADHISKLRQLSAKVFRESVLTGETRKQVSDRLYSEAMKIPGFEFIGIDGRHWKHKTYFEMLARTELMNSSRASYDEVCAKSGCQIMKLSVSGECCDACKKFEGTCFTLGPNSLGLPTKDDLIAAKVFHPNCTHSYSAVPEFIFKRDFNPDGTAKTGIGSRNHKQEMQQKQAKIEAARNATHQDIRKRNPQLHDKTVQYFESLSPEERETVRKYTNGDEYHLSKYLRAEQESEHFKRTKTLDREVQKLNRILEKAPKWDGPELFRGMSFSDKESWDKFYASLVNNDVNFGFMSTSYDYDSAVRYSQGNIPVMIHIMNPKNGALLADYSAVPSDREVLFPENIKMELLTNDRNHDIIQKDGIYHVYMKEASDGNR